MKVLLIGQMPEAIEELREWCEKLPDPRTLGRGVQIPVYRCRVTIGTHVQRLYQLTAKHGYAPIRDRYTRKADGIAPEDLEEIRARPLVDISMVASDVRAQTFLARLAQGFSTPGDAFIGIATLEWCGLAIDAWLTDAIAVMRCQPRPVSRDFSYLTRLGLDDEEGLLELPSLVERVVGGRDVRGSIGFTAMRDTIMWALGNEM